MICVLSVTSTITANAIHTNTKSLSCQKQDNQKNISLQEIKRIDLIFGYVRVYAKIDSVSALNNSINIFRSKNVRNVLCIGYGFIDYSDSTYRLGMIFQNIQAPVFIEGRTLKDVAATEYYIRLGCFVFPFEVTRTW